MHPWVYVRLRAPTKQENGISFSSVLRIGEIVARHVRGIPALWEIQFSK